MYQDVCLLDNDCYAFAAFYVHAHALRMAYNACLTYSTTFAAGPCFLELGSGHEGFLEQESGVAYALPAYAAMKDAQAQLGQLTQSWLDIQG